MSGNVWEWCEDDWHDNYKAAPDDGKAWIDGGGRGAYRVGRGGSWSYVARYCRVALRSHDAPSTRYYFLGFRLVRPS